MDGITDIDYGMALIRGYVHTYRADREINPTPGVKFELSCEAFGEGWNLLNQLIFTNDGDGYWPLIKSDPENRRLVLDYIEKEILWMQRKQISVIQR